MLCDSQIPLSKSCTPENRKGNRGFLQPVPGFPMDVCRKSGRERTYLASKNRSFCMLTHPIASMPIAVAPATSAPNATARDAKPGFALTSVIRPPFPRVQHEPPSREKGILFSGCPRTSAISEKAAEQSERDCRATLAIGGDQESRWRSPAVLAL
jgi:hypothetical protein